MKLEELTKDEKSLLLYLETRAVDHGGLINMAQMNCTDVAVAERWAKDKFIKFGRIAADNIKSGTRTEQITHWCELTDTAFALAHQERIQRARRMLKKRAWRRAGELSLEAQEARMPLPPGELVGALQDSVHYVVGKVRAASTIKIRRKR